MDKLKEKPLAPEARRILEALCDHPLLSRRQLELYLGRSGRTTREFLRNLRQRGLVQQVNAHEPRMTARSLQMPTSAAIAKLAQGMESPITAYSRQTGLNQARLDQLISLTERVFQVRTLLLWLLRPKETWNWKPKLWDVEVEKKFYAVGRSFSIPFHGAALFERSDGQWAFGVIELDTGRAPVHKDRERLANFVLAQDDRRFWQKESERTFPVLIVIAQDEFRLQDYYSILRSVALARGLPMPRTYLTTARQVVRARNDVAQPIWYSTISGRQTTLLFDTEGVAPPMPSEVQWQRIEIAKSDRAAPAAAKPTHSEANNTNQSKLGDENNPSFADLVFALKPLDKLVLDEIANHPLLTARETASLMRLARWRVQATLRRLTDLKLVEPYSPPEKSRDASPRQGAKDESYRYMLAKGGLSYLAMIAGFGTNVKRYAYARGWANGFEGLLRHWEHTRAENDFFLELARIAREKKHRLNWLSELESRLYYSAGNRWHSFLPDGRGTYRAKSVRYEFALEIDRSRSSQSKFRRKLNEYLICVTSNVLRGEGIELLRLLVVTTSWERAETLRQVALPLIAELRAEREVQIYITTFDRLGASGIDAAIWLHVEPGQSGDSALTMAKTYCFDCFVPKPKEPRTTDQAVHTY